jgi:hypothetical protein
MGCSGEEEGVLSAVYRGAEEPSELLVSIPYLQWLKKLSQCLAISNCSVYNTMLRKCTTLKKKVFDSLSYWLSDDPTFMQFE